MILGSIQSLWMEPVDKHLPWIHQSSVGFPLHLPVVFLEGAMFLLFAGKEILRGTNGGFIDSLGYLVGNRKVKS